MADDASEFQHSKDSNFYQDHTACCARLGEDKAGDIIVSAKDKYVDEAISTVQRIFPAKSAQWMKKKQPFKCLFSASCQALIKCLFPSTWSAGSFLFHGRFLILLHSSWITFIYLMAS